MCLYLLINEKMEDYFSEKYFSLIPEDRALKFIADWRLSVPGTYWKINGAFVVDESIPSIVENCRYKSEYVRRFSVSKIGENSTIPNFLELRSGLLIDWVLLGDDYVSNTSIYYLPTFLTDKWNAMLGGTEYKSSAEERRISFEAYLSLISSHRQNNELIVKIGLEETVFNPAEGELIKSYCYSSLYQFKSHSGRNNSMIYARFGNWGKIELINDNRVKCDGDCNYEPEPRRLFLTNNTYRPDPRKGVGSENNCNAKIFSMVRTTYAWSPPNKGFFELLKNQWEGMGGRVAKDLFEFDDGW